MFPSTALRIVVPQVPSNTTSRIYTIHTMEPQARQSVYFHSKEDR